MTMPITTDDEAFRFIYATVGGSWVHAKSVPVMARWRRIALDPKLPGAANYVAQEIAGAGRLWDHPQAADIAEIITTDILKSHKQDHARMQVAWGMQEIRQASTTVI